MTYPTSGAPYMTAQQPLGSKQYHLGIISNSTYTTITRHVLSYTRLTKLRDNLNMSHKLYRSAKCVTDSAP